MENIQIVSDIWRRKLIDRNPDISDILENYDLTSEQQVAVDEYIDRMDRHLKEREQGRPSLKAYWDTYRPIVRKANNYVTVAGVLIGGILGYVADKNPSSTTLGAVFGGFVMRSIEDFFHPIARRMGMPNTENIEGCLSYLSKARESVENKLHNPVK